MPLSNFLKFTFTFFLLIGLLTSCSKDGDPVIAEENIASTSVRSLIDTDNQNSEHDEHAEFADCFTIVFPLDIAFPDGTTQTYNSLEEIITGIEAYLDANPNSTEDPMPIYPITVELEDGETQVITNDEEMEALVFQCVDNFCPTDIIFCFEIDYPITIIYADDTTQKINNDDEFRDAIIDWESNAMEGDQEPTLDYPIQITKEDGTAMTINNDASFEAVFDSCYDQYEHDYLEECFEIEFPITLISGEDRLEINNTEELYAAIKAHEEAYPNDSIDITAVYPVTINYPDGTQKNITSDEEIEAAYEECAD